MMFKSLLLPAMASLAYAESTVTSMFIFNADEQPLAASIVGNDATATTYSINCPPGTPGDECGMGPGLTLIAADDTTTYIFDDGEAFQYTAECSVENLIAVCTESAGGSEANFPGVETTTADVVLMPVTVTAGSITDAEPTASSPASPTASSTGSGKETPPATSTSVETTSAPSQASETASKTASESASETASATPTGAAGQLNGAVGLMFGGAAVALMGALL